MPTRWSTILFFQYRKRLKTPPGLKAGDEMGEDSGSRWAQRDWEAVGLSYRDGVLLLPLRLFSQKSLCWSWCPRSDAPRRKTPTKLGLRRDCQRVDTRHSVAEYPKDCGAWKRSAERLKEFQWTRGNTHMYWQDTPTRCNADHTSWRPRGRASGTYCRSIWNQGQNI